MTRELGKSEFDAAAFNPHAPEFLQDPYPVYQWFRRYQPVAEVFKHYQSYWVFRHADIQSILNDPDPDLWSKRDPAPSKVPALLPNSLFLSDPSDEPSHTSLRSTLAPVLLEALSSVDQFVHVRAGSLISSIRKSQQFDLIADYANPLPCAALGHVLGVPDALWLRAIVPLIDKVVKANDPTASLVEGGTGKAAMLALRAEFKVLLKMTGAGRKLGLSGAFDAGKVLDLMISLTESPDSGFSAGDFVANAASMTLAGYFSTTFLLGTGIASLLQHPDSLQALKSAVTTDTATEILQQSVGEMLRFDAPIQIIDRFAKKRTRLGGKIINPGDRVALVIGSANRDEEVFSEPTKFDINRKTSAHLSFGDGIHRCLGAPMLGKVAPAALYVLLKELPDLSVAKSPVWQSDPYFRGFKEFQVALGGL